MSLRRIYLNKKDIPIKILAEALRTDKYDNDQAIKDDLFPEINMNAFYRLKNRMNEEINKSLLLLNYDKDDKISIYNVLSLVQIFIYKAQYSFAYRLLKKAEKKAIKNDHFSLLNLIYDQYVFLSGFYHIKEFDEILKRKKKNDQLVRKANEIDDVLSEITWNLRKVNFQNKNDAIFQELIKIKEKINADPELTNSAHFKLKLESCIRQSLLQQNDFKTMQIFLKETIATYEKEKIFTKDTHKHKIVMQAWLVNALLKLKHFDEASNEAENLKRYLSDFKGLQYKNYIWTYYQSHFASNYFSGKLKEAEKILDELEEETNIIENSFYQHFLILNRVVVLYNKGEIKQAHKSLGLIQQEAEELSLQFHLDILDILFLYEQNDFSFGLRQLHMFKKRYKDQLTEKRSIDFIQVLELLLKNQDNQIKDKVKSKMEAFLAEHNEFEPGSNEAIHYGIWLESKLSNESYYDVFLRTV